jgi:tetratricopeptide (TPR) repeat protein
VPELEYIFKHALAQETTYESILLGKRRELHARVGQAIETLFADRLEEFYGLLAYHYARAEVWEKAQEYLFKAGDQAGQVAADAEALTQYEQALAAYERAFGDRWDPVQRAALERKMGEALFRRGEHAQAREYFERALTYLGKPLPTSRRGVRLGILREIIRQIGHRLLPRLFLKPMDTLVSPAVEEANRITEPFFLIEGFTNPERCFLFTLRSLNGSERSGLTLGVVTGFAGMVVMFDFITLFRVGESYVCRAVALAEQFQDPKAIQLAYTSLASHSFFAGWDTAIEHSLRAAELSWEIGDLRLWGWLVYQVAITLSYQGNLSQALIHCQDLIRFGQEGADSLLHCMGLAAQGFAQWRLGQFDEAIPALQKAIELARAIPAPSFCTSAGADLGRCYLRQGDLGQALTALRTSQGFYVEYFGGDAYASLRNGSAEAYLLAAEQGDKTEKDDWLKKSKRACRDSLKLGRVFHPALPEAMRLQGTYEWLRGKSAPAQKWWQRSLALAEERGQHYDLGMTHLEMGQRLGERIHLERAEAILAEIGAARDLARAREALGDASAM